MISENQVQEMNQMQDIVKSPTANGELEATDSAQGTSSTNTSPTGCLSPNEHEKDMADDLMSPSENEESGITEPGLIDPAVCALRPRFTREFLLKQQKKLEKELYRAYNTQHLYYSICRRLKDAHMQEHQRFVSFVKHGMDPAEAAQCKYDICVKMAARQGSRLRRVMTDAQGHYERVSDKYVEKYEEQRQKMQADAEEIMLLRRRCGGLEMDLEASELNLSRAKDERNDYRIWAQKYESAIDDLEELRANQKILDRENEARREVEHRKYEKYKADNWEIHRQNSEINATIQEYIKLYAIEEKKTEKLTNEIEVLTENLEWKKTQYADLYKKAANNETVAKQLQKDLTEKKAKIKELKDKLSYKTRPQLPTTIGANISKK